MHPYGYIIKDSKFEFKSYEEINEIYRLYKVFLDNYKISKPAAYYRDNRMDTNTTSNKNSEKETIGISRAELLLQKGKKYKEKQNHKREELYNREIKDCTFKPMLHNQNYK